MLFPLAGLKASSVAGSGSGPFAAGIAATPHADQQDRQASYRERTHVIHDSLLSAPSVLSTNRIAAEFMQ